MRTLMWFRNDLRVEDNPALHAARRAGSDGMLAVFVFSPGQWREHDMADIRAEFVRRSVADLSEQLASREIALRILVVDRFADVPDAIAGLAREHGCEQVHANAEYEVNEVRRDEATGDRLAADGRGLQLHHDQCILPPGTVRTGGGGFYSVFTPFKRNVLAQLRTDGLPEVQSAVRRQSAMLGRPDPVPEAVPGFPAPPAALASLWPAGAAEARRRLERFTAARITGYADTRDLAAEDATSRLSPYLAVGAISPRRCLHAAVEADGGRLDGGSPGIATWISELLWRDFYRHVMVGWPRVSMGRAFKVQTEAVRWSHDEAAFDAWCEGRTGFPIVDAGMRQLLAEGWMHNRLRMITAMFLSKDLLIDWRWGERHFMRHLIDGDLASNNGGWQWSASTGTDAQPYFRVFNPTTQGKRFDPEGAFIRRFVPELEALDARRIHEPAAHGLFAPEEYPRPMIDHAAARDRAIAAFKQLA
ncbi:MAG: deoxyribodipyrimidine photo-lyase [Planctomycetota bacterium]|jgi:deoxyribodipyrimidine photo-lyase